MTSNPTDTGASSSHQLSSLIEEVGRALKAGDLHLATAESCTGGLIAASCTAGEGASDWFHCGFVTYSLDAKIRLLGVDNHTLQAHGAVSEAVCTEMALGALTHSGADMAVAVTGLAGPGGGDAGTPVGTVWIGWATAGGSGPAMSRAAVHHFEGSRKAVIDQAVHAALHGVLGIARRAKG